MKAIFIISVLFLFLSYPSIGQDEPAYLNQSWKELTAQLQRRNDVAGLLLIRLRQTNQFDTALLQKTRERVKEFTVYLREKMTRFDSSTVRLVFDLNQSVSADMGRTLVQLEMQPGVRKINNIISLLQHLGGTEKRLYSAIQQHNELALKYKRLDLAFHGK